MHRFYEPDIATTQCLGEEQSKHCVRVLRMSEGDEIEVVDGKGTCCRCRITEAHPKRCTLEIITSEVQAPHWRRHITLAVAPTKHLDRMEWLVEKAVEIGVDRIIPLRCHNSERTVLKTARLRAIMVSAMKQSLKATLPQLDELTPFDKALATTASATRYIAYCDPELPRDRRQLLPQTLTTANLREEIAIFIGPEGDFSPEEAQTAMEQGCVPVSLGDSRLRTETAAIVALTMLHAQLLTLIS